MQAFSGSASRRGGRAAIQSWTFWLAAGSMSEAAGTTSVSGQAFLMAWMAVAACAEGAGDWNTAQGNRPRLFTASLTADGLRKTAPFHQRANVSDSARSSTNRAPFPSPSRTIRSRSRR